ncbi:MAG: hypothetical protein K9N46_09390 [Candidatus Marinimicrobia bacterium]|nr:hypothetical protein [Candidatus Neomarinimicrobiota bacterium]MCF7829451.1 hypothetical protein [Candidatus Neomarinimicrobiota bacterium]MCF7880937.1 hypothetical protein [Candidatus Neomarinimicrobiota bacterium]
MNVQEFLEELRKDPGYSDPQISDATENRTGTRISSNQIWMLRTGKSQKPQPSTARILADAFGYQLDYVNDEPVFLRKEELTEPAGKDYHNDAESLRKEIDQLQSKLEEQEKLLEKIRETDNWHTIITVIDEIKKTGTE